MLGYGYQPYCAARRVAGQLLRHPAPSIHSHRQPPTPHLVQPTGLLVVLPLLHLQVAAVARVGVVGIPAVRQGGIVAGVVQPQVLRVVGQVAVGVGVADGAAGDVAAVLPARWQGPLQTMLFSGWQGARRQTSAGCPPVEHVAKLLQPYPVVPVEPAGLSEEALHQLLQRRTVPASTELHLGSRAVQCGATAAAPASPSCPPAPGRCCS